MSISGAAKVGTGLLAAASAPAAVYAASDYIFLYAVEREVIGIKDLKIVVTNPSDTNSPIKITATKHNEEGSHKLPEGYDWSCEIKVDTNITTTDLATKIQKHLPKEDTITDKQRQNKKLLVKLCASNREGSSSNSVVKGTLKLKQTGDSGSTNLFFENHSELNFLLGEVN